MIKADIQYPNYTLIESSVKIIIEKINLANKHYDYIIGITRGGLFPALLISHILDKPLLPISYSSKQGAGDDKNHANDINNIVDIVKDKQVIVVDDICDSGYTLKEINSILYNVCDVIDTASLYYKINQTYQPTYFGIHLPPDAPFIYFPWENITA